jgi:phage terminase large subunit-like protein
MNRSEFEAYKEELESRANYTFPTEEELEDYQRLAMAPKVFKMDYAKQHPFLWMYHVIGIKPRDYQFKMLDHMFKYSKVAGVTSRQIGKTTMAAGFAFWAAVNNMYPSGPMKDTKIMIISQTEDAAKKMLRDIDSMITLADQRMAIYTKDTPKFDKAYFRSRIKHQTQFEISFPRGSIKVFPPTTKVRGNTVDVLIIDEAAFLKNPDPDYFFASEAVPTTTATNGKIFIWSTPKSTNGFFHDIIRPHADEPLEGWKRLWMPWTVVSVSSILDSIWQKRQIYIDKGDELDFKIEYEGSFLSGKHSYFNPEIIDQCIDETLAEEYTYPGSVTMGLDFGDVHSRTVLTVFKHDPTTKITTLLWYKEFPAGYNNADIPEFIESLRKQGRYYPKEIVVDDCVGGKTAIELLKRKGFNVTLFQFTTSKHEYYEYLKVAFANKRVQLYNDPKLIAQLKALESVETQTGKIQIRKPIGGRDDIVDSLMMGCSPFIKIGRNRGWRFASEFKNRYSNLRVVK